MIHRATAIAFLLPLAGCRESKTPTMPTGGVNPTLPVGTAAPLVIHPGVTHQKLQWQSADWHCVTFSPEAMSMLRLNGSKPAGNRSPAGDFAALISADPAIFWLMNAGMFHADGAPVGLCIADGKEITPLNTAEGHGNFFLKPNGVFAVTSTGAIVTRTKAWAAAPPMNVRLATQSGPLLVDAGKIHSAFRENSPNKLTRNGVGVTTQGAVCFAISSGPVNLHDMATLFRDALNCPDALYLDGTVSAMYLPAAGLHSQAAGLGPVFSAGTADHGAAR